MEQFDVQPDELSGYAQYLRTLAGAFDQIDSYTRGEGCRTDGFTGLLTILRPAVDTVGDLYGAGLDFGQDRMIGTADGLDQAASDYARTDEATAAALAVMN